MISQDDKLIKIKKSILGFFPDCKIILFGSRAKDNYDEKSDYDLVIIVPINYETKVKLNFQASLRQALAKLKIPADILIQSESEFEAHKNLNGHIIKEVAKEGILI
jgi:predicted nucleotidyltransferase